MHEDKDIVVLSKPKGMPVHPAPGSQSHQRGTLVNFLCHKYGDLPFVEGKQHQPGIVHRIDQDTSGIMVVARTEEAYSSLSKKFREHDIERRYVALSHGIVPLENSVGTIDTLIGKNEKDIKRRAVVSKNAEDARRAITHYKVLERFNFNNKRQQQSSFSLIETSLVTVSHQNSFHLSFFF